MFISAEVQETTVTMFDEQVATAKQWFASPRFAGIVRLYSPAPGRRAAGHDS